MPHTKALKLQENFAQRNENTNPKIQVPIKNVENITLLSQQKERERKRERERNPTLAPTEE